jgi:regulator of protease activity HflC (stomatin/prohibitin superfamily)
MIRSFNLFKNIIKKQKPIVLNKPKSFFTIIRKGFTAQKTFLGENSTQLDPGFHLFMPIAHKIQRFDMRENSLCIYGFKVYTKDNIPVSMYGSLGYKITDSKKACFEVSDIYSELSNIGKSSLSSIVGTMDYKHILSNKEQIDKALKIAIGDKYASWGVDYTKLSIESFLPQNNNKYLNLNMGCYKINK